MAHHQHETGTHNATYDLVSILYHALQGAETYNEYMKDADEAGERELGEFFREVKEEEKNRADRAKNLLMKRLGHEGTATV